MRKNLLYIGNRLSGKGGAATTIDTLGPMLETEGFYVRYASVMKNKALRMMDMLFSVILYSKKADYVLIDTYSTQNFWYAFAVAKTCQLFKIKYVPILHGGMLPERLKKSPKSCRTLFAKAYRNVAPSRYLWEAFRSTGFDNLEYIPNNIKINDYTFKQRGIIRPKLLWVRAFSEIYNPMLALKALKLLLKEYPKATLCMIGPDKDGNLSVCKTYAKKHGLPVKFTGKLSKKEWRERSKEFDVFLNTTHIDNTPISVIEVMALGLPVISTNVGGIPYLLEDKKDALLVADDDTEGVAASITLLIKNPEIASNLTLNARTRAEGFDWENVRQAWLRLLD